MEPIKYYSISAAAKGCGVSKQMMVYAYRNRKTRIVRRNGGFKSQISRCGFKVFKIEWLSIDEFNLRVWVTILRFVICSRIFGSKVAHVPCA